MFTVARFFLSGPLSVLVLTTAVHVSLIGWLAISPWMPVVCVMIHLTWPKNKENEGRSESHAIDTRVPQCLTSKLPPELSPKTPETWLGDIPVL